MRPRIRGIGVIDDKKAPHRRNLSLEVNGLKDSSLLHEKTTKNLFNQDTVMANPFKFKKSVIPGLRVRP